MQLYPTRDFAFYDFFKHDPETSSKQEDAFESGQAAGNDVNNKCDGGDYRCPSV